MGLRAVYAGYARTECTECRRQHRIQRKLFAEEQPAHKEQRDRQAVRQQSLINVKQRFQSDRNTGNASGKDFIR